MLLYQCAVSDTRFRKGEGLAAAARLKGEGLTAAARLKGEGLTAAARCRRSVHPLSTDFFNYT